MKVIVINGRGGCGKDTFVQYFTTHAGEKYVLNISTVDKVKEIARSLGWKDSKNHLSRKYLSDLKDMATYWGDIPFQDVAKRTTSFYLELERYGVEDFGYVFIHCREPKEIKRLQEKLPFKTYSLLIRRPGQENYGNHADDDVENYTYDYIINNDTNLDDLDMKSQEFYNILQQE